MLSGSRFTESLECSHRPPWYSEALEVLSRTSWLGSLIADPQKPGLDLLPVEVQHCSLWPAGGSVGPAGTRLLNLLQLSLDPASHSGAG